MNGVEQGLNGPEGFADMTLDQKFEMAVNLVLRHEGGYVCDPRDPGGATKFGISAKSYPDLDIKSLTIDAARLIYRDDWWEKCGFWRIDNPALAAKALDVSVNVGAVRGIRWLQTAAKKASGRDLDIDGVLGLKSEAVINSADPARAIAGFLGQAYSYYELLGTKMPEFKAGWMIRLFDF